jgi:hypothetical protein
MARLTSVTIRRFKRIEDLSLDASGKSSILQAIHFAVSIAQTARLIGEGVSWRNDAFEVSYNPSQLLYSPVGDVHSLATGGALQEPRQSQIEVEFRDDAGAACVVGLRRGRNRNIAVSLFGRQIGEQLMAVDKPFTIYAPGLAGVPKEERYMSPGVVRRIVARGDANLTLRNVLRMLKNNETAWSDFIADMQSIFGGIEVLIEFDEDTDENINAYFQLPGGPRHPIDAAGTSVLQASQILAYISLFAPRVLILDEPDSHLHPDNQRILCDLIFKLASKRGFQALISTHSRHVLDTVKSRGSVVWLSKGVKVDTPDLNTTKVLLELGALDSAGYFADGQLRCVVATEDTETDALRALLWSNGFIEDDTEVASYAGCTKADAAVVLGRFLIDKAPHVHVVVHRDRDYMSDSEAMRFEETLTDNGILPFVTANSDLEAYFISAEHLHVLNPTIPLARLHELIEQATDGTADQSIEALVNLRTREAFRLRQVGGAQPNHGAIAVKAQSDYHTAPATHRRGKIVLGRLTALLQQELRSNPRIYFPRQHLEHTGISSVAASIWSQGET